ncbi:sigma-70 family RNA polymerase sigma factor [Ruficoccus amylovorans]|uniref:Sigma-70 family RNA polymerase sigma factor n=1 Tax=Ruficoccus amylovorans TaxID=1804625 RepID=A0A842HHM1_9BACT|nr:sigma-70 family RNA polymerase sigma factor [Ruficoccus amylovorans]
MLSERACRGIIAAYRRSLDWVLHLPLWEGLDEQGLRELGLPQPRRGINLRAVVDSLLLENKHELINWLMERFEGRFPSKVALAFDDRFALDLWSSRSLDVYLSQAQWAEFREKVLFTMSTRHRQYKRAQTVLFRRYQSLTHKLVNRQVFDPNLRPDAFQEASIGLIHAIDKVEDNKASFGSYARTWISRHIRNYLMEEHFPVHVPINLASRILTESSKGGATPEQEKAREPSKYEGLLKPRLSLDDMADDSEGNTPRHLSDEEAVAPSDSLTEKDLYRTLLEVLDGLTDKQREVLALRFGLEPGTDPRTLASIASEVGISHQQVSMREKRALQKLESALKPVYQEIYD